MSADDQPSALLPSLNALRLATTRGEPGRCRFSMPTFESEIRGKTGGIQFARRIAMAQHADKIEAVVKGNGFPQRRSAVSFCLRKEKAPAAKRRGLVSAVLPSWCRDLQRAADRP